jgi:predicted nucleic acid-binding protein
MMPTPKGLLLDTDIVIQLLKKRSDVVECFIKLHEQGVEFYLSPIVIAEVYVGAFKKEHPEIEAFFNLCTRLTLEAKTAKQAGLLAAQYRKAYQGISLEDYLLAATAGQLGCPLWTQNKKHYPMHEIVLFDGL